MKSILIFLLVNLLTISIYANFDIDEYKNYLLKNKDMTVDGLLQEYPAGYFLSGASTNLQKVDYADSIIQKFNLTEYETDLISKNGFMVTERLSYYTFMQALWDIYKKDMPVFISTDAILHALHYSFDKILIKFETEILLDRIFSAIQKMKINLGTLNIENTPLIYKKAVYDLDIYLTVAEFLISDYTDCTFTQNESKVIEILELIDNKKNAQLSLFSETKRNIDFSQFTPRGHYTRSYELTQYFSTMTWLGRTEVFLSNPINDPITKHSENDLQRMAILSALIAEVAMNSGAVEDFEIIENVLSLLLGKQDNINLWEVNSILKTISYTALDIANPMYWKNYREKLFELNSTNQLYISQILYSDPNEPEQLIPPSVFLLMGQRPIIDAFITANVTYDNIMFEGKKVERLIPSTLDILFSLGNDAAIQLLHNELKLYPYSTNLAALRYLIDSYDNDFWESTIYTNWISAIRSLNPPLHRENLPLFMQTAAWWQKSMNTQLASWSELRHDFILYAKQSYSVSDLCSYPYGYVEPVPEFYKKIKLFFRALQNLNNKITFDDAESQEYFSDFINNWMEVCDNLLSMSEKILAGKEFSDEENNFLCSTISIGSLGCYNAPVGWYPDLHFNFSEYDTYITNKKERGNESDDFIVADVHTTPTDTDGNNVGWVLHAGTGRINMAVITAPTPDGITRAYIGPVYSYYEFLSNDFKRLSNKEWREMDGNAPASRPAFTNLYLAKNEGVEPIGDKVSLFTVTVNIEDETNLQEKFVLNNYPNPFTNTTVISFSIPNTLYGQYVELSIFDIHGNIIIPIIKQILPANNYSYVWDGTDENGKHVAAGSYIYTLKIGEYAQSGKMTLIK